MHTPINSRTTPIHSLTAARVTDPNPAFPSQQLLLASDANGPADQAGHAGGRAGIQMGSHREGSSSPQVVAISPQDPQGDSSIVSRRQCEEATNPKAEGTPTLFGDVDQARRLEAMVSCSWGEKEGSATKMLSHQRAESLGLDIDAFLPPSLSPRQARSTALPCQKHPQKLQKAFPGFAMCIMRSCLLDIMDFVSHRDAASLCSPAAFGHASPHHFVYVCVHACVCSCVCVCVRVCA